MRAVHVRACVLPVQHPRACGPGQLSDADLQAALDQADVSEETATAALEANQQARLDGLRAALVVLALLALFAARRIPIQQPGSAGQ
jgi:hypothetical protein